MSAATELVCSDCMGDEVTGVNHEACRREGGYMDDEDNALRCGCHLAGHALDNRKRRR